MEEGIGLVVKDDVVAFGEAGVGFIVHDQQGDIADLLQLGADLGADVLENDDEIDAVHGQGTFGLFEFVGHDADIARSFQNTR